MLVFNDDDDINSAFQQNCCSLQANLQPAPSKRKRSSNNNTKRSKNKLTKTNKDFLKALGLTVKNE